MPTFHFFFPVGYALAKVHEVVSFYFQNDPDTVFHHDATFSSMVAFIKTHRNDSNCCVVFYYHPSIPDLELRLSTFVNGLNLQDLKLKILFLTFDFWLRPPLAYTRHLRTVFPSKNCFVSTFAPNAGVLTRFHQRHYDPQRIIFMNTWACYRSSFVKFNENPLNQIAISGAVSVAYPERRGMVKLMQSSPAMKKRIVLMPKLKAEWNSEQPLYNQRLNQYVCCFSSGVYARVEGKPKLDVQFTGIVLLKNYEILASGSLLLCPSNMVKPLESAGLVVGTHFLAQDMKQMPKTVLWITDPANREAVDTIRRAGQAFARANLTTAHKYQEMKKEWLRKMFPT